VWDYVILGLVLWPCDVSLPFAATPEAWQALKTLSQDLDLVGPHERWASNLQSELNWVRYHSRALLDAPVLAEGSWLPPYSQAAEICCFNERFQQHLLMQRIIFLHRGDDFDDMLRETRHLYQVWDAVRRSSNPHDSWANRRRNLQRLKQLLGDEAFYGARLPPWVPVWRFQVIQ